MDQILGALGGGIFVLILIGLLFGIMKLIFFTIDKLPIEANKKKWRIEKEKEEKRKHLSVLLKQLINDFGIKEPVPDGGLKILFSNNLYAECTLEIMRKMGLTNTVKIICYPDEKFPKKDNSAAFITLPLSQVGPSAILSSTKKIEIAIKKSITKKYETFVYVIAHELSHIILHGKYHKLKDSEEATDIYAIISGFAEIIKDGIHVTNYRDHNYATGETNSSYTTYGYINYSDFMYLKGLMDNQKNG